jgi:hypothetical protein
MQISINSKADIKGEEEAKGGGLLAVGVSTGMNAMGVDVGKKEPWVQRQRWWWR